MSKELWELGEFPFFELGEDGFPRPGKVCSYYRSEMKKRQPTWTQERLAKQLGVTKQWVWEIENRDRGFDSISLRRELARQFAIPLLLLGLASLEDEPHLGQLIKRHRQLMTGPLRTQAGLAKALGITEK